MYHDWALRGFPHSRHLLLQFDFFIDLIDLYPFFSIFGFFQQAITYVVTDTGISLLSGIKSSQMIVPFGKN